MATENDLPGNVVTSGGPNPNGELKASSLRQLGCISNRSDDVTSIPDRDPSAHACVAKNNNCDGGVVEDLSQYASINSLLDPEEPNGSVLDHESISSNGMDDLHFEDTALLDNDDFVGRSNSKQEGMTRWFQCSMSSIVSNAESPESRNLLDNSFKSLTLSLPRMANQDIPPGALSNFHPTGFTPGSIPKSFYCPLTMEVMIDPVIDYEGHSYERISIESWLKSHNTSPVTRNPLKPHHLAPNLALKAIICEVMGEHWLREITAERRRAERDKKKRRHKGFIEHQCMYRTKIDDCLKEINGRTRLAVRLNARGLCAFTFKHLKFVIEVPEGLGSFFFYTSLGPFPHCKPGGKVSDDFMKKLLQHNNFPGSMGMSLDPESNEIIFSRKGHVDDVTGTSLQISLEAFIEISLELQKKVDRRFRPDLSHLDSSHGDGGSSYNCLPILPSFMRRSRRATSDRDGNEDAGRGSNPHRISLPSRPRSLSRPRSISRARSLSRRRRGDTGG